MNNRSNKYISDALMIADDLMGPFDNQSGNIDETGFIIAFGLIRDYACKIWHQAELQGSKPKLHQKHTNAVLVIIAAVLSIFFASPADANIILSTDFPETLGGLSFTKDDLAEYDPSTDTATLYFDGALFSSPSEDIDAAHVLANGNIILSTDGSATLGGLSFNAGDLVEYDATMDTATLFFDGGLFTASENIDAAHILDNGNIILSTIDGATLGGLTFGSGDLIEYNPLTDTSTLFFDGSLFDGPENIDAVHLLDNGNIIISTAASATLGGMTFADGDLVEYNPTTDVATLYFSEGLFSNNANVNAVYVTTLPEPATIALLGLGMLALIIHRHRMPYSEKDPCYITVGYQQESNRDFLRV
jgi:hypothetical protein